MAFMADPVQSFSKSLFAGRIHEDLVFPYPAFSKEDTELLSLIIENLKKFKEDQIDSVQIDRDAKIPESVLGGMREMGLFGLIVPEKYGGMGLTQMAYGRVFEEIGALDGAIAATLGAHSSIGLKGLLLFGTDAQKEKYLPKLASGEMIAAFALTEPGAGSDAYSIKTRAVKQPDGSYVLNGNKIWITNGGIADFFTVFAKTAVDSKDGQKDKVTAFIVTRDMKGVSNGKEEHKLGIRGSSTTEISLVDVKVPAENILGEEGKGFKIAMEVLNSGRLGLGTGCVGGAKKLLKLAVEHASSRKQFGKPIAEFGLIKDKLGRMTIDTYVTESVAYMTCGLVDRGVPDYSVESAISKIAGSEMVWSVANEAMQIAGGSSYMQEYPYERMLRDARINMIFEGTNEILRCFIALSGMKGIGEYLQIIGEALNAPIKSLGVLYDYLISKTVQPNDKLSKAHPELKKEVSYFEDRVPEFADAVEKSIRKHRKHIWEMQFVQKRIAEMMMDLYRMISVISRVSRSLEERGVAQCSTELNIAHVFCSEANRRIKWNLKAMDRNLDESIKSLAAEAVSKGGFPYV
jgi:acyl-CoA dehydrogenase family member 9